MAGRYWVETLGCPKNQVDSDKLAGLLESEGYRPATGAGRADLVVVNTCAFIEAAREESIEVVLGMAAAKKDGAKLVVTGCMAERYGEELAEALPEVDRVAGFGAPLTFEAPVTFGARAGKSGRSAATLRGDREPAPGTPPAGAGAAEEPGGRPLPSFDLLNLPRPRAKAPWAYVKVAEGCDRRCGFCAIPSFRGAQRSRTGADILDEVSSLGAEEVVLVAQDLVSWGRDAGGGTAGRGTAGRGAGGPANLVELLAAVRERVTRARLLYLYPSGLSDELIDAMGDSGCPYFDLSLQHASAPLLRRMRRFGDGERFLGKVSSVRRRFPDAALRSSFIIGYPGETEHDHDELLQFLQAAQLDWAGFFAFSPEEGTYAAGLPGQVPAGLVAERARECSELQDAITAKKRSELVGTTCRALVDRPGQARSHREAPEIDGVIRVPRSLAQGTWVDLRVTGSLGPDVVGVPVAA